MVVSLYFHEINTDFTVNVNGLVALSAFVASALCARPTVNGLAFFIHEVATDTVNE
jgi:hypothetical protein